MSYLSCRRQAIPQLLELNYSTTIKFTWQTQMCEDLNSSFNTQKEENREQYNLIFIAEKTAKLGPIISHRKFSLFLESLQKT